MTENTGWELGLCKYTAGHLAKVWRTRGSFLEMMSQLRPGEWVRMTQKKVGGESMFAKATAQWSPGDEKGNMCFWAARVLKTVSCRWCLIMGHCYSLRYLTKFLVTPHPFVKDATIIPYHCKRGWLENQDAWFPLLALLWESEVILVSLSSHPGSLSFVLWHQGWDRFMFQQNILWLPLPFLRYGCWVASGPLFFVFIMSGSSAQERLQILSENTLKELEFRKRFPTPSPPKPSEPNPPAGIRTVSTPNSFKHCLVGSWFPQQESGGWERAPGRWTGLLWGFSRQCLVHYGSSVNIHWSFIEVWWDGWTIQYVNKVKYYPNHILKVIKNVKSRVIYLLILWKYCKDSMYKNVRCLNDNDLSFWLHLKLSVSDCFWCCLPLLGLWPFDTIFGSKRDGRL